MIAWFEYNAKASMAALTQKWPTLQPLALAARQHKYWQIHVPQPISAPDTAWLQAQPGFIDAVASPENFPRLARLHTRYQYGFSYRGVDFFQDSLQFFLGLNAVDEPTYVEQVFQCLAQHGLTCARMGVFKPRTRSDSFQGRGVTCLPYVFELAGKYGIKVIALEITHESQLEAIDTQLNHLGHPCGVMLQIGTRNAQNFELLKAVGRQQTYPILYKRGFGITLDESLHACEYLAHAGNPNIIFCLRGVKSLFAEYHRNLVDFAHIPVVKRLTRLPVCADPSHAVGTLAEDPDKIPDIFHVSAQSIIAGANMLLVDVHPVPKQSLVDKQQALGLDQLEWYLADCQLARQHYLTRKSLARRQQHEFETT